MVSESQAADLPFPDFIAVHDKVLPSAFCDELIRAFEASDKRAPGSTGHGVDRAKKLSTDITMNLHVEWETQLRRLLAYSDEPIKEYLSRLRLPLMGALSPEVDDPITHKREPVTLENWHRLGAPRVNQLAGRLYRYGSVNIQHYRANEGAYLHWHSEIYPKDASCETLHRVLFFMFYLNDVAEGGETEFYYQARSISPRQGRMVIAPAGFTHTHRGNVPISNDKYIATSWVMFQRAEQLFKRA